MSDLDAEPAATTRRQVVAVLLGLAGAVALFVLGLFAALAVGLTSDTPEGGTLDLPTWARAPFSLAGLSVAYGFWRVMKLGQAAARARGEDPGAPPPLTWRTLVSPRGVARYLFETRSLPGTEDELVGKLGAARGWVGLVVVLSVIAWFDVTAPPGLVGGTLTSGYNLLVVSSVVLVVVVVLLFPLVPPAERGAAGRALLRPLGTLALIWALAGALSVLGAGLDRGTEGELRTGAEVAGQLVLLAALVWLIVFAVLSAKYVGGNVFRSGEAHPSLPPLISLLVTWGFVALSALAPLGALLFLSEEAESPVPGGIDRVLSWTGLLTVSALCALELYRLARRGYRLPAGPWGAPQV